MIGSHLSETNLVAIGRTSRAFCHLYIDNVLLSQVNRDGTRYQQVIFIAIERGLHRLLGRVLASPLADANANFYSPIPFQDLVQVYHQSSTMPSYHQDIFDFLHEEWAEDPDQRA